MISQTLENRKTLLKALDRVTSLACRFFVVENVYRSRARLSSISLEKALDYEKQFEASLTSLYALVLEINARALCYLQRGKLVQVIYDSFNKNDWSTLLQDIDASESQCMSFTELIDGNKLHLGLQAQQKQLQTILDSIHNTEVQAAASKKDEELKSCLQILRTCPYEDRKNTNCHRVPGTCEWFVNHRLFKQWNDSRESTVLLVSADPGCGKSVLTRYLVDEVLSADEDRPVCYFFFKDGFDHRMATHAISSLIHQLFWQKPELIEDSFVRKLQADGDSLVESFTGLWSMLERMTLRRSAGEIVCVLDALDECHDPDRLELIRSICELTRSATGKVKFLITSRPYSTILRRFRGHSNDAGIIRLSGEDEQEIDKIAQEIDLVIRSRVDLITNQMELEDDEKDFLLDQLLSIPHRTYLWVTLTLDVIENVTTFTKGNVRDCVQNLPSNVDEAYERILRRSQDIAKTKKLLHLVTSAFRPLTLAELSTAMAVEDHHTSNPRIEVMSEKRFKQAVRDLCGLFLTIIDSRVYLLHQTAREFLVRKGSDDSHDTTDEALPLACWKQAIHPVVSHRILAETCMRYLKILDPNGGSLVLFEYSSMTWFSHFRYAKPDWADPLTALAVDICTVQGTLGKWYARYQSRTIYPAFDQPLSIVSCFGIEAAAQLLLTKGAEVDCIDRKGRTPLMYAVSHGHSNLVKLLLSKKADVNRVGSDLNWPLSLAILYDYEKCAMLLLEHGADINLKNAEGTALNLAAENNSPAVINQLLARGADVNSRNERGITPLGIAVFNGDERLVAELVAYGADINIKDNLGNTALSFAADQMHEEIVEKLLKHGAYSDVRDGRGETALSLAVPARSQKMIEILLDSSTDLNIRNGHGRTPLFDAVILGEVGTVRRFIRHGAEVDIRDNEGVTPLQWVLSGHCEGRGRKILGFDLELQRCRDRLIQTLTDNGASLNIGDEQRERALLRWAERTGNQAVGERLRSEIGVKASRTSIDLDPETIA